MVFSCLNASVSLESVLLTLTGAVVMTISMMLIKKQYIRLPGEPPLVSGGIPFLGVAIPFGKNARKCVEEWRAKYGDCFTVFLAGQRFTFLLDAQSIPDYYRMRKTEMDFMSFVRKMTKSVFRIPVGPDHALWTDAHKLYAPYLQGTPLTVLSENFMRILDVKLDSLAERFTKAEGRSTTTGLFDFCSRLFFEVGTIAMFGEGVKPERYFDHFVTFENKFKLLAGGIPFGVADARRAQDEMARMMTEDLSEKTQSQLSSDAVPMSMLVAKREEVFRDIGVMPWHGDIQLSLIVASQLNTYVTSFWTLLFILSQPETLRKVLEEMRNDTVSFDKTASYADRAASATDTKLHPVLNACISETLRLNVSGMHIRVAQNDLSSLRVHSQQKSYSVRRGDTVTVFTPAPHRDPRIYSRPSEFDHTRFLQCDMEGPGNRGKFVPFGGGVSLCPGRHLARREIMMFTLGLLSTINFSFQDEAGNFTLEGPREIPEFDEMRSGQGALPPANDIPCQLRLKRV